MTTVWFFVPGDAVGKARHRHRRRGGTYTPAKTENYENLVKLVAAQTMGDREPMEGPLKAEIVIGFTIPASWSEKKKDKARFGQILPAKKPDIDNLIKIITDGMNKVVYQDDAQIVEVLARKIYSPIVGVSVTIQPIKQASEYPRLVTEGGNNE